MKLEAVPSAAKAYQGSVPRAAGVSGTGNKFKPVSVSSTVKAPKPVSASDHMANAPKTANLPNANTNIEVPGRNTDAASVQAADEGKVFMRDVEEPEMGEKTVIYEDDPDVLENTGMQQNSKQLQEAVEKLKEKMAVNTEAVFGIHEGTNRVMIKIVDKETKDVLKEYPPEKTLDMIQKVWEMAGIMVDEKL